MEARTRSNYVGWLVVALVVAISTSAAAAASTPLVKAVTSQDVAGVRALLDQPDANPNVEEADGATPLHYASKLGSEEMVAILLAAGARADVANRYGVTPLSLACESGSTRVVERLLEAGADPNTAGAGGATVLMTAARTGTVDVIKALLVRGADVNATEDTRGQTALMWAAAEGNVDALQVLIEAGADINAGSREVDFKRTSRGGPAAMSDKVPDEIIQFTPLMFAIREGYLDAVELLLDLGADPNEKLIDGVNGVLLSIINAHWELAGYLLDRGADPNAAEAGWTALHQVARSRSLTVGHVPHPTPTGAISSMDLAKKLIAMGADVNARMTRDGMRADGYRTQLRRVGASPYLLAAKGVDHDLMRLFLSHGADPLLTNEHGMRPLGVAAGVALHATGEDSGTHSDALEALTVAYEVDQDVNYVDERGHTALMGAARRGSLDVVRFLVERGAKLDATILRDNFVGQVYGTRGLHWTPLTIAVGFGSDGEPLFLGSERSPEVAAYLYTEMTKRGLSFEHEDPAALAVIREMVGETAATSASAAR